MLKPVMFEDKDVKLLRSPNYNYNFDKNNGYFAKWGRTKDDDPLYSPCGPELIDIEITDSCYGPLGDGNVCNFCYKSNTPNGSYMSFETFRQVFNNLPKECLTQIAFGVDSQCITNPDTFKIMQYCRDNGVIPNVTIANISDNIADRLSELCGAVAVSFYGYKDICYNSVKKLIDRGMKQVNIHNMICQETINQTYELFNDYLTDSRLKYLNAIVLLSLKTKGRGKSHTPLTQNQFNDIVNYAENKKIPLGFDSCSVTKLNETIQNWSNKKELEQLIEPCESGIFSFYINTYGKGFPCSFIEGEDEWKEGFDLTEPIDFLRDIWYGKKLETWRFNLLSINRSCPKFNI
ncbi:MAG: radical SAM protein [Candidatus Woesearchaeota archaeon]